MDQAWPDRFERILLAHLPDATQADLVAGRSLLGELGLDSLRIVSLVADLEAEFDIELPYEKLAEASFGDARALWSVIDGATGARAVEPERS